MLSDGALQTWRGHVTEKTEHRPDTGGGLGAVPALPPHGADTQALEEGATGALSARNGGPMGRTGSWSVGGKAAPAPGGGRGAEVRAAFPDPSVLLPHLIFNAF